jgi:uncharacterized membrane protein
MGASQNGASTMRATRSFDISVRTWTTAQRRTTIHRIIRISLARAAERLHHRRLSQLPRRSCMPHWEESRHSRKFEAENRGADTAMRIGALAGAAALVGFAARRRSPMAVSGATAVAIPLVYRGATGRWPLEPSLARPVRVVTAITVRRSAEDIYDFWRRLENLPRFMRHLESVEEIDAYRSRWVARTPLGNVSWEAEITDEERGSRIAWRSLDGSQIDTWGRVELDPAPAGRGTQMRFEISLQPPASRIGRVAAALLQPVTEKEIRHDVHRFKSLMEAGEIPTTQGQPHGSRATSPRRRVLLVE